MAVQPWRTGEVIRIEDETFNTKRFWIKVPELDSFDFKPGQFVTLDLPIGEKTSERWRSYSISSWPYNTNIFELVIVLLEDGRGSHYLFHQVSVGSQLSFRGPQGVFVLKEPIESDLFFICTGTGIAPFRSMVHHLRIHQISHQNIYLIFGTRRKSDLLYYEEMKNVEIEMSSFHYMPTLSREEWDGRQGYVHAVYETIIQEKQAKTNQLPAASFFLCGWKNMIDDAKQKIIALGYDKKSIHQEIYG